LNFFASNLFFPKIKKRSICLKKKAVRRTPKTLLNGWLVDTTLVEEKAALAWSLSPLDLDLGLGVCGSHFYAL